MQKKFTSYPYYNKDNVLCIGANAPISPSDTYNHFTGKEIIKECNIAFIQNARNREWTNVALKKFYDAFNLLEGINHK
jgi:hypothetical protein